MVVPRGPGNLAADGFASTGSELYCPFVAEQNPWADDAQERSLAWALEHGLVTEGAPLDKLSSARFALLEAAAFPHASRESLSLVTNWVTLFCALDDYVEDSELGVLGLSGYLSRLLTAFRADGALVGDPFERCFQDIGRELRRRADASFVDGFVRELEHLFAAFVWEEVHRRNSAYPDYVAYRTLRIATVGLLPQFVLFQALGGHARLSEAEAPVVRDLERLACLIVGWANDIFTYEKEVAQGEGHNLIAVLMRTESLSLREAFRQASALHDAEVCEFLRLQASLDLPHASAPTRKRVEHLRHWLGGHLSWARNNGRYRPNDVGALNRASA
jgi:hypothetical protein